MGLIIVNAREYESNKDLLAYTIMRPDGTRKILFTPKNSKLAKELYAAFPINPKEEVSTHG